MNFTKDYLASKKELIQKALKALDKKNLTLIIHANSFPSDENKDTGFGTINSSAGRRLIDFASGIFTSIQLGPNGKTKFVDPSPYTGTIFSGNPLFIDLEELTMSFWGNILSLKTFNKIVKENPNKGFGKTAYEYIYNAQNEALKEAFENFKKNNLPQLKKRFEQYKNDNSFWLEKDSLYESLTIDHDNDYWPMWDSDLDKNLFSPKDEEQKIQVKKRVEELKEKYRYEIEFYSFCQFVLSVQNESTRTYALSKDIKMIADRQVAFSDRDVWGYKEYFLEGWSLGCPPDYFSENGQAWGFPVMNPDKIFNADGSLNDGGKLLKALYKKMFEENPGGVRIDHIVGLIDPWVYKTGKNPKIEEGAGRLYSSPEHSELSKFAIVSCEDLDFGVSPDNEKRVKNLTQEQIKRYGAIIEKIVIAAANECGLDKDAIVCEDLGTLTNPVEQVLRMYDLQGMRLTQFVDPKSQTHPYRCKNIEQRCWVMVGTHDNEPISMWADKIVNTDEANLHANNLVEDLWPDANEACKIAVSTKLSEDPKFLAFTKLVEIFASKAQNVQIFFTDFFGIKKCYNRPGTSGDQNWSLRLPNDFESFYLKKLKTKDSTDLPLILKLAMEARGVQFAQGYADIIQQL